jgi:dolichol-phosphate mannosyltransferase
MKPHRAFEVPGITPMVSSAGADSSRQSSYKLLVVLPVFNEEANIAPLLERIDDDLKDGFVPYRVVAVDDGSSDRSSDILAEYSLKLPIEVHRHSVNQGLGATLRDGLLHASNIAGAKDIIVTMDADETHTPGLILSMIRKIREGHDVVIASRYQPGAKVVGLSRYRRCISWLGSFLMRIVFPTEGVRDFTCGYRAYRAEVLKLAMTKYGSSFVDQDDFQCMVDVLLKLRRMRLVFGEVPLILRYDLKKGSSKMRVLRTAKKTLRLMFLRRIGR